MKCNKWTLALAAAGVVSLGSVVQAEEAAQHQVLTALSSTTLSGYIDTSVNWRVGNSAKPLWGRSFDAADKQDGFNLNVVSLTLEKPMEEGQWAAGYKAQLLFGPDANYYTTLLNGGGGGDLGGNDVNIKDAYVSFRAPVGNGLDFKLGVFTTVVGYEVFESANNPNFSRSFGFALEPTHHTGLLASYHVNDVISIAGGIANSWFGAINGQTGGVQGRTEGEKTFLGAITITLPEKAGPLAGSALYFGIVDGRIMGGGNEDTTHYYGGLTVATPVEGLSVGGALDYRDDGTLPGSTGWAWSGAGYLSYQATEKLKLNARGDYLRGVAGTFYPGGENELVAVTVTADYNLWAGLITRLEGRWDHALKGGDKVFGDENVFTVALNAVYKF